MRRKTTTIKLSGKFAWSSTQKKSKAEIKQYLENLRHNEEARDVFLKSFFDTVINGRTFTIDTI